MRARYIGLATAALVGLVFLVLYAPRYMVDESRGSPVSTPMEGSGGQLGGTRSIPRDPTYTRVVQRESSPYTLVGSIESTSGVHVHGAKVTLLGSPSNHHRVFRLRSGFAIEEPVEVSGNQLRSRQVLRAGWSYFLGVQCPGYMNAWHRVDVSDSLPVDVGVILMRRGCTLEGMVVDMQGSPVANREVVLRVQQSDGYQEERKAHTNTVGFYRVEELYGIGLRVFVKGITNIVKGGVHAFPGDDRVLKLTTVVRPTRSHEFLSGRVVDEHGQAIAGLPLQVFMPESAQKPCVGNDTLDTTITGPDGDFEMWWRLHTENLHGKPVVRVTGESRGYSENTVLNPWSEPYEWGTTGIVLRLVKVKLAEVRVRLTSDETIRWESCRCVLYARKYGSMTDPARSRRVSFRGTLDVSADGLAHGEGIFPGDYCLVATSADASAMSDLVKLRLGPGSAKEVEVKLVRGEVRRFLVLDSDRRPLRGVKVESLLRMGSPDPRQASGFDAMTWVCASWEEYASLLPLKVTHYIRQDSGVTDGDGQVLLREPGWQHRLDLELIWDGRRYVLNRSSRVLRSTVMFDAKRKQFVFDR
jgi:hypothetical protein